MAVKTKSTDSSYGWVVLAVTFLAGFTAPANMAKVTALAPVVMQTFGFGPDTLGWVIALFYVLGFVMAFPTAGLINKLGIRNVVLIAIGCAAVGSAMGALTENVTVFMVSRFLEGAGMGVMGVAGASAIAPWFAPEKRGFPLGIWAMWVALAMCICPVLYGYVVDTLALPWQTVWWGTFVFDIVVGIVFLITLFGNMVSWSFGVNFVAEHAARKKNMPKVFAHESEKNQMPTGAAIVNGVVASVLVLLSPVMELAGFDGFFWIFFSMNIVFLLISYIPMFPAFLKLRTIDPAANRVFKVPGGRGVALVVAWVPVILLVLAIIATIVPLNGSEEELSKIPMLIGVIVFVVLGEVVRIWSKRGRTEEYKGLTPALAAERLAEEAAEEAADEAEAPEAKGDAEPEAVPVA